MPRIKSLIDRQKVYVDTHGHNECSTFDDPQYDIHLHKETKYRIGGKYRKVDILVPLNSERNVSVRGITRNENVPPKLLEEINEAFSDEKVNKEFVDNMMDALKNYPSKLDDFEKRSRCVRKLGKAFGFDWEQVLQVVYKTGGAKKKKYITEVVDVDRRIFSFILEKNRFSVEDTTMIFETGEKEKRNEC